MRYAVLSDIHSNLEALTAVLDHLASERIDRTLCLGDMVGYGADPAACLERLHALDAVMVGGNHDLACVGKFDVNWFNQAAKAAILWTRDQLSVTDLDRLRRLPLTTVEEPFAPPQGEAHGVGFTLTHASLRHPERFEYLMDAASALDTLAACRTRFCLVGHTHLPCVLEYDRAQRRLLRVATLSAELADFTYADADDRGYLINPGSVGQPRDGDPRASAAIIDTDAKRVAVRRVAYDVAAAQAKIRNAGLPAFLAERLAIGR